MKPLSLTMQAFGSYLQKTEIDFSLLGDGTIFLITGSTGGGKTTILDAMCFALYCRSTGGHRSWDEMRCTAAPDDLPTLLDFSFRLGSETYRFFRKRQAYRKRGSGERAFREEHSCYRLSGGEWELIETGAETRIRERAQELLHLTCEQFSQVIVLPQGEFLRLLRANSVGKAEILKTLFATGLWQEIARAAKSRADTLAARAGEIRAARASLLEREGVPDADGLSAKLASLRKEIADREEESSLLSGSLQKEEAAFAAAKLLEQKFRELSDAQRQAARLESEKPAQALREKRCKTGAGSAPYCRMPRRRNRRIGVRRKRTHRSGALNCAAGICAQNWNPPAANRNGSRDCVRNPPSLPRKPRGSRNRSDRSDGCRNWNAARRRSVKNARIPPSGKRAGPTGSGRPGSGSRPARSMSAAARTVWESWRIRKRMCAC